MNIFTESVAEAKKKTPILMDTTLLSNLRDDPFLEQLREGYSSFDTLKGSGAERAMVSIVNSIITHRRVVFAMSRDLNLELTKADPNWKKSHGVGFGTDQGKKILSFLTTKLLEGLSAKTDEGCHIYMVKDPTLLAYLESLGADADKQLAEVMAFVDKGKRNTSLHRSKEELNDTLHRAVFAPDSVVTEFVPAVTLADKPTEVTQETLTPTPPQETPEPGVRVDECDIALAAKATLAIPLPPTEKKWTEDRCVFALTEPKFGHQEDKAGEPIPGSASHVRAQVLEAYKGILQEKWGVSDELASWAVNVFDKKTVFHSDRKQWLSLPQNLAESPTLVADKKNQVAEVERFIEFFKSNNPQALYDKIYPESQPTKTTPTPWQKEATLLTIAK